jgi:anti-sigma factor RsiW
MRYLLQSGHVSEESLGLYTVGDLPESRVAGVEQHLHACSQCRKRLEGMKILIAALRMAAGPEATPAAWLNLNAGLDGAARQQSHHSAALPA